MSERVKVFTTENGLPELPCGRFRNEGPNGGDEFRVDHSGRQPSRMRSAMTG